MNSGPRTLPDRVLAMLPRFSDAPLARDVAKRLEIGEPFVRRAFERLEAEGRAKIVRRGRGLHLVPADYPGKICPVCRVEYVLPKKSKRRTCSRSCGIKWSWQQPEARERREAALKAWNSSPERSARQTEINNERWADPAEHAKMSEANRKRWRDPVKRVEYGVSSQRRNSTPEAKARQSAQMKAYLADPEWKARHAEAVKRGKNTPEYRAKHRELMKARWADPEMRAKYTAANRARNEARAKALKGRKQSPETVAKRVAATKKTKARKRTPPPSQAD